ncbi:MAG TPA: SDR family NAD(P)-dependent oxidoreductase [Acidimicrobiales bacterium]|jgi:NAD(P)-dependent dehydrogenase (short-subunit alcohol dehydrogenase family)
MGLLDGKVAVVTGAGHGVGRGYALDLAAAGAKVVVNDLGGGPRGGGSNQRDAEVVAEIIRQRGGEAVANFADVADYKAAGEMIDQAVETFGSLDVLVLNAGILRDKMIFNLDESDWDDVVRVHLKGHFSPARHASSYWREKSKQVDGGRVNASVITTSSLVGLQGNVGQTNYTAAKGGIAMFTVSLGLELERYGVRVNCVAPSGNTRLIGITVGSEDSVKEPDEYEEFDLSNPGNVAPLIVWLGSDLSQHVNGQIFMVQGTQIHHYQPFTRDVSVSVPGGAQRKWEPEEVNRAMNSMVFGSRHPGLMAGMEFQGGPVRQRPQNR